MIPISHGSTRANQIDGHLMNKLRCAWVPLHNPHYVRYHDEEWGVPVQDDDKLFEALMLEGAQAGLSWETILHKRTHYRASFHNFDPEACARMPDTTLEGLMNHHGIIRNRLKIHAIRKNATVYLRIQEEWGSFSKYIWAFVGGKPLLSTWDHHTAVPSSTPLSKQISQDLKKRGMCFVGPTMMYAFMQATGLVNDHTIHCFRRHQV